MFLFGIFATPLPYVIFFFIYLYGCAFVFHNDIPAERNLTPGLFETTISTTADHNNTHGPTHLANDALLHAGLNVDIQKAPRLQTCAAKLIDSRLQKLAFTALSRPPPLVG